MSCLVLCCVVGAVSVLPCVVFIPSAIIDIEAKKDELCIPPSSPPPVLFFCPANDATLLVLICTPFFWGGWGVGGASLSAQP